MIIATVVPQYPFDDLISFASELYDSNLSFPSWFVAVVLRLQSFCSLFSLYEIPNFFLDCPFGVSIHRDSFFVLCP